MPGAVTSSSVCLARGRMKALRRCCWAVLPLGALLAGCQSVPSAAPQPTPGEVYVSFVRDMMVESARLKTRSGEGSGHAEAAVQAVGAWRGAAQDGDAG